MICKYCGANIASGEVQCPVCRGVLSQPYCSSCSAPLDVSIPVCPRCKKAYTLPYGMPQGVKKQAAEWKTPGVSYYKTRSGIVLGREERKQKKERKYSVTGQSNAGFNEKARLKTPITYGRACDRHLVNDKWIWLLAILPAPVACLLSRSIISAGMQGRQGVFMIVLIIANAALIRRDIQLLREEKRTGGELWYFGVLLAPLYILLRERKTNRLYGAAIIALLLLAGSILLL